jgi:hypothetical protein
LRLGHDRGDPENDCESRGEIRADAQQAARRND